MMDATMQVIHERLLLVDPAPQQLLDDLKKWLGKYDISFFTATNGIEAIEKYKECSPGLMLINCNLPDMNGMSLSSILKDEENGNYTTIYLYNIENIYQNTKADYFFLKMTDDHFRDFMRAQITEFYDLRFMQAAHSSELIRAQHKQYEFLPSPIDSDAFRVMSLFSAYGELSGDGYNYWLDDEGRNLYGLLFDCTGHDILSFTNVNAVRIMLSKDMKMYEMGFYKHLSEVLKSVNDDLFAVDTSPEFTAAVVFKLDLDTHIFRYAMAGAPGIMVRHTDKKDWDTIESRSFILGFDKSSEFEDKEVPLDTVQDIIVCSDGFYEVTSFHEKDVEKARIAKHDDVSAIIITLHQQSQKE